MSTRAERKLKELEVVMLANDGQKQEDTKAKLQQLLNIPKLLAVEQDTTRSPNICANPWTSEDLNRPSLKLSRKG